VPASPPLPDLAVSIRGLTKVYAPSGGGEPSDGIGAVPATWTRSPTTTAREKPATASYGECPVISLRSTAGA
jgi:hypothetical protein